MAWYSRVWTSWSEGPTRWTCASTPEELRAGSAEDLNFAWTMRVRLTRDSTYGHGPVLWQVDFCFSLWLFILLSIGEMVSLIRKYLRNCPRIKKKKSKGKQFSFQVPAHFFQSFWSGAPTLVFSPFVFWVGEQVAATFWPDLFHVCTGAGYWWIHPKRMWHPSRQN